MVFLGTDFGLKYVIADIEGEKDVVISFRDSYWKGVYDVSILGTHISNYEIKNTYPGFPRRIQEAVFLIRLKLKHTINRISKRNRL